MSIKYKLCSHSVQGLTEWEGTLTVVLSQIVWICLCVVSIGFDVLCCSSLLLITFRRPLKPSPSHSFIYTHYTNFASFYSILRILLSLNRNSFGQVDLLLNALFQNFISLFFQSSAPPSLPPFFSTVSKLNFRKVSLLN